MNISEKQKENTAADVKQHRFQEKIFAEQINILYKNLLISVPASMLCATLIFIAVFRIEHTNLLEYWYMATIFMSFLRLGLSGLYLYDHKATKSRFYLFYLSSTVAAILWGFAGYALMPENHLMEQMITIVIIAGITAGGIQSLQASLLASLTYMGVVIIPLCFWVFSHNETVYTILGIATTFYLLFTIPLCWRGYQFLNQTLVLKYENLALNEALREQAIHDPLTGLFNRRYLNETLSLMLNQVIRTKHTLCVCMIDLDYFKKINDQYGHDAGDEVLIFLGKLLTHHFRKSDFACRFGGEEFIVVLMNSDLKQATLRMEQLRQQLKNAQIYAQNHLLPPIMLSVGIAEVPQHGETLKDILHSADSALYAAKEAGRDRIVVAQLPVTYV